MKKQAHANLMKGIHKSWRQRQNQKQAIQKELEKAFAKIEKKYKAENKYVIILKRRGCKKTWHNTE